MRSSFVLSVVLILSSSFAFGAAQQTLVKETGKYLSAPQPLQLYIKQVKTALKKTDPVERCLAFPDIPDNKWPKGFVTAYCQQNFGPRMTLLELTDRINNGQFDLIDTELDKTLELHFNQEKFSEAIHQFFELFEAKEDIAAITDYWVKEAPNSPYAQFARASYFINMAYLSRGTKWASDTTSEQLQRMTEFFESAIQSAKKAVELEPRLMPAYAGLVSLGKADSRQSLEDWAFNQGMSIDPACQVLINQRMLALQPRWGGDYQQMELLARQIAPFAEMRPLVSLRVVMPWADLGDRLFANKKYSEAIELLTPITLVSNNLSVMNTLGFSLSNQAEEKEQWKALYYLLAYYRFDQKDARLSSELARALMHLAEDYSFAIQVLEPSAQADLEHGYAQLQLMRAYGLSGNLPKATQIAQRITTQQGVYFDAHYFLGYQNWREGDFSVAVNESNLLVKEFPANPMSWWLRSHVYWKIDRKLTIEALDKFIELADRDNEWQRMEVRYARKDLEKLKSLEGVNAQ